MACTFFTTGRPCALVHVEKTWTVHFDILKASSTVLDVDGMEFERVDIPETLHVEAIDVFVTGVLYRRLDGTEPLEHLLRCLSVMAFFGCLRGDYAYIDNILFERIHSGHVREHFHVYLEMLEDIFRQTPATWALIKRVRRPGIPMTPKNERALRTLRSTAYDFDPRFCSLMSLRNILRARRALGRRFPPGLRRVADIQDALRQDYRSLLEQATDNALENLEKVYGDAVAAPYTPECMMRISGSVYKQVSDSGHVKDIAGRVLAVHEGAMEHAIFGAPIRYRYSGFTMSESLAMRLRDALWACFYHVPKTLEDIIQERHTPSM